MTTHRPESADEIEIVGTPSEMLGVSLSATTPSYTDNDASRLQSVELEIEQNRWKMYELAEMNTKLKAERDALKVRRSLASV